MVRGKDDKMTTSDTERRAEKERQWREIRKTTASGLVIFTISVFYSIYAFRDSPSYALPVLTMLAVMYIVVGYGHLEYRKWKSEHLQSSGGTMNDV